VAGRGRSVRFGRLSGCRPPRRRFAVDHRPTM